MDVTAESGDAGPSDYIAEIGIDRIMQAIPHRPPMLMIDRVVELRLGQSAIGVKNVTINEDFFRGHFPERPVMPGVMLIESMAQTSATLVVLSLGAAFEGKIVYFMTVDNARFRRPVGPGDQLRIHVERVHKRGSVWKFKGTVRVDGVVVAEAAYSAMIVSPEPAQGRAGG